MAGREEPFAAFVGAYRRRLIGIAALVHLDPDHARSLVDDVLARLYASWPRLDDPYTFALRAVLRPPGPGERIAPRTGPAFVLVDVAHLDARPDETIGSELAALSVDERQILVLASYARLPMADIAKVLDRDEDDVVAQRRAAEERLRQLPRRHGDRRLAAELAAAASVPDADPGTDLPRVGRTMLRRRRLRLVAAAAALVVLAGFGIRAALPTSQESVAAGTPAASATPPPPCDTRQDRCRADIVAAWRADMAGVVSEYLDPAGQYFTGSSYSYTEDAQGRGFWGGGEGAMVLELFRMRDGATEVYLQIATSRAYAIRCGQLTGRACETLRLMDGNRYTVTDPFDVAHGLEVQQRPMSAYVITIVARNTSKAKRELPVTRADLISLIADPRLQLPPR